MYIDADIYLCLSIVEGSSYSVLDAMLNNLLIVSTNVGIMENEIRKESFVELSWDNLDIDIISEKIRYIWNNKKRYQNKSREEYNRFISWDRWEKEWKNLVSKFYLQYQNETILE